MTALIVDDDYKCIELIRQIITIGCPDIATIHTASSAMDGVKMIQHVNPDIVFLDIMMPHHTGFELLECFPQATFIVAMENIKSEITEIDIVNRPKGLYFIHIQTNDIIHSFKLLNQ